MEIRIENTLSGKKDVFKPIKKGQVSMYHCGPTVYNRAHVGNLRAYVFANLLRRIFTYQNYKVNQVINITDVGHLTEDSDDGKDKVEEAAKSQKQSAKSITEKYTLLFFQDLEKLNINIAEIIFPRATQYIVEQIQMIVDLEKRGLIYKTSDGIYFDTSKIKNYGKLGKVNTAGIQEGARIGQNDEKKNPTDFALWKFSEAGVKREQEWQSPWGIGFPGWHIECSAMIKSVLGEPIDIHTGGIEHIPIHHNNEIAQSESISKKELSHYWIHLNHILVNGEKMSKSTGNVVYLDQIKNPLAYRYWLLTSQYNTLANYTDQAVDAANTSFEKLIHFISKNNNGGKINKTYIKQILENIFDNFNTSKAIATIWTLIKDSNITDMDKAATILEADKILGLNLEKEASGKQVDSAVIPAEIVTLAEERKQARENKDWQKSDELRNKIQQLGYKITDSDGGYEINTL